MDDVILFWWPILNCLMAHQVDYVIMIPLY